jgi:hypothetical protein
MGISVLGRDLLGKSCSFQVLSQAIRSESAMPVTKFHGPGCSGRTAASLDAPVVSIITHCGNKVSGSAVELALKT